MVLYRGKVRLLQPGGAHRVLGRYHGHCGMASRTGAGLLAGPASRARALEGKIEKKAAEKFSAALFIVNRGRGCTLIPFRQKPSNSRGRLGCSLLTGFSIHGRGNISVPGGFPPRISMSKEEGKLLGGPFQQGAAHAGPAAALCHKQIVDKAVRLPYGAKAR